MDSAELLDILGNANRRRILRLLAHKPCYVTEISEYLGVSPKAVIDHLDRLEQANLIESHTEDGRRKYFSIANNLRLEVQVSPYEFGAKSAYPASRSLDISSCRYVSIHVEGTESGELHELAAEMERLKQLERELSLAQRWVQGRLTEVREGITDVVDEADGRLFAELFAALADGRRTVEELSRALEAPPELLEPALDQLEAHGVVEQTDSGWTLRT
jgi:ArsR family transcriptional regulator